MGTIECSQPASKSSWDSQDFGDISMVLKMAHFRKSTGPRWVNSLRLNDAIWRHRSGSIFAQVMACCLKAPSHYLSQYWLFINEVCGIHMTAIAQWVPKRLIYKLRFEIYTLKYCYTPKSQRVNTKNAAIFHGMSTNFIRNVVWSEKAHL